MRSAVRHLVPLAVRKPIVRWIRKREQSPGKHFCPVCQSNVRQFLPHGNPPRERELCPICQSKVCHRLSWAFFNQAEELFAPGQVFLHIAPEPELGRWLERKCRKARVDYRSGDLRDQKNSLDLQATGLPSESIDCLFACHVLNAVHDDKMAVREIARILRPSGLAVLPVPFAIDDEETSEREPGKRQRLLTEMERDPFIFRAYTIDSFKELVDEAGLHMSIFSDLNLDSDQRGSWECSRESIVLAHRAAATLNLNIESN